MFALNRKVRRRDSGMSMIELMVAMTLLAVGMAGAMVLISTSIASNNRNKVDTTATVLSEMMVERIAAGGIGLAAFTITDCQGNSFAIDLASNPSGSIDYHGCSSAGTGATYTISWQVAAFVGPTSQPFTRQVSVTTRQTGTVGGPPRFFAPPATLRTVIGR